MTPIIFAIAVLALSGQPHPLTDNGGRVTITAQPSDFKIKIRGTGTVGDLDRVSGSGVVGMPESPRTGGITPGPDMASGSGTVK